jgi:hypothetical protein
MTRSLIDIIFDGPPGHTAGRFVEVENGNGRSINTGEWFQRSDKFWVLRFYLPNLIRQPAREGTWEDIGCYIPRTCQAGCGDPPQDWHLS